MQPSDDVDSGGGPLPGLKAVAVGCAAVALFVLVAGRLDGVPQDNEPEHLRRAIAHIAVMAVLTLVAAAAAIVAVVRGACGRGRRGVVRAVPILLGTVGLVASAVCVLLIFASLLGTRDV